MATTCGKDETPEVFSSSRKTGEDYERRQDAKANEVIGNCVSGGLTPHQAKGQLVKQYLSEPKNILQAVEKLESALGSGKIVVTTETRMTPAGRVISLIYSNQEVEAFECIRGGGVVPVMPNPEFSPIVVGNRIMFQDNEGVLHWRAEDAVAADIFQEANTRSVTGGNCPQDPRLVPDFVSDPSRK